MSVDAIITICVILGAIILFATEAVSIDLVGLLIIATLVISGVITPEQGVAGFSNNATITVAFMFILSAALLKTGALQYVAHQLSNTFRYNFNAGLISMMVLIAIISAFINNTPVVAVFIPVIIQIGNSSGQSVSKMLIPLSFASIFGGMCTLIGTSTNILVSGIAEKNGLPPLSMFTLSPIGVVLMVVGIIYMVFLGVRLLPKKNSEKDLNKKFGFRDYLTDIELLPASSSVNKTIMDSPLVKEHKIDIIEVRRNDSVFSHPQGDFLLLAGDVMKVRCDVNKIKSLHDKAKVLEQPSIKIGEHDLKSANATIIELIITSNSDFEGKNLKEVDFRRKYRGIPLAIKHHTSVQHEELYSTELKAGDILLAEVKSHYVKELRKLEGDQNAPFVLLSEEALVHFAKKRFVFVLGIIFIMVLLTTMGIIDIMTGSIAAVSILVLFKMLSMKEAYEAINWKIVFLIAGALSLGSAMSSTGLDDIIANTMVSKLGVFGPVAILSGLYITTSILTEIMSNNAAAALLAPIAIATAQKLGLDHMPFLVAITLAASASFMTPIGYQTNTMVYSAGQYRFRDFIRVGALLNLFFWIVATFLIPVVFPF